jgi:hypothetical protein
MRRQVYSGLVGRLPKKCFHPLHQFLAYKIPLRVPLALTVPLAGVTSVTFCLLLEKANSTINARNTIESFMFVINWYINHVYFAFALISLIETLESVPNKELHTSIF